VITLVLGGTRSGKSEVAERLASRFSRPVTYVATGRDTDPDMAARIASHRARRPADWSTVEAGADLPDILRDLRGTALVDALGSWVAAVPDMAVDPVAFCEAVRHRSGDTIVVSEEVGLGVHPVSDAGRRFADILGTLNRMVADVADAVWLVIAGRVLPLERSDGFAAGDTPGQGDAVR
jgi:adenosylcobinamide kinase / adenosylcobinamide-phosphate guanylyltransferase